MSDALQAAVVSQEDSAMVRLPVTFGNAHHGSCYLAWAMPQSVCLGPTAQQHHAVRGVNRQQCKGTHIDWLR
jgi:hypothetical protein